MEAIFASVPACSQQSCHCFLIQRDQRNEQSVKHKPLYLSLRLYPHHHTVQLCKATFRGKPWKISKCTSNTHFPCLVLQGVHKSQIIQTVTDRHKVRCLFSPKGLFVCVLASALVLCPGELIIKPCFYFIWYKVIIRLLKLQVSRFQQYFSPHQQNMRNAFHSKSNSY